MSEYKLFVQRVGLSGIVRVIYSFRGLIILPLFTKSLGATNYGIWSQVLIIVLLAQPFVQLSLAAALVRYLSSREKKEVVQGTLAVLLVVLAIGVIAALIVFLLSNTLSSTFLGDDSGTAAFRLGSVLIILEALCIVSLGSFRIFGQIKRYALVLITQTVLEIGLIAIFILSGNGLIGAIISLIITKCIILSVTLYLIISYAGITFPNFSALRGYLTYSLPLIPSTSFSQIVRSSDRFVIGYYLGAGLVGIYSAAYSMGNILLTFSSLITFILHPTVFSLHDRGRLEEVKTYLSNSWRYIMMFSIPMAAGLSILAEPLMDIMTTSEFIAEGKTVLPIVAWSAVVQNTYGMYTTVVLMSKRTIIIAVSFGVAAAINLGLNILLVPYWGIIAAAFTTLISYMILAVIIYHRARKYLIFDHNIVFIIKSALSSGVMSLVIWVIEPTGITEVLFSIITGAVIYFGVLFFLRGLSRGEVKLIFESLEGVSRILRIRR